MGCGGSKEADATKPAEKPVPVAKSAVTTSTAAVESKKDVEKAEDEEAVCPPVTVVATTNKPFSSGTGEDVIITSTAEDLTEDSIGPVISEESVAMTIDPNAEPIPMPFSSESEGPTPSATADEVAEASAAADQAPPAPMVKRTSVKDRIKRVNSMERRSTSGRYAPDSPLLSQKLEYDYLIKIAIIGDIAVGKSSLQGMFVEDSFKSFYKSTKGTDFKFKSCVSDHGSKLKIQCWDTAGKERLQGTSKEFFLKMLGFIMVFDVTNEESFHNIKNVWYKKTELPAGTKHDALTVRLLVGNKAEEENESERKVSPEQGEQLAKELGVIYAETSAKNGANVEEMFKLCANEIVDRIMENTEIYDKYKQTLY